MVQRAILWRLPNQRYQCHPLLSRFLAEMITPDQLEDLKARFVAFYAGEAAQMAEQWPHTPAQQAQNRVLLELDNLRQAWSWALETLRFDQLDMMLPLLHHYYERAGWFQEAYTTFGNLSTFVEQHIHEDSPPAALHLYAHALRIMGKYAYHLGYYADAQRHLEQSRATGAGYQAPKDTLAFLEALASVHTATGEYEQALKCREESVHIARRLGWDIYLGNALSNIAIIHYHQGRLDKAEEYFNKALKYYRQENDETHVTAMLNNLGNVAYERGAYREALDYLERCLPMAERIEGQTLLAAVLDSTGKVLIAVQKYREAWRHLARGLHICRKTDAIPLAMEIIINVGALLAALGDMENAILAWQTAASHPQTQESVHARSKAQLEKHGIPVPSIAPDPAPLAEIVQHLQQAMEKALSAAQIRC